MRERTYRGGGRYRGVGRNGLGYSSVLQLVVSHVCGS